MKKEKKVMKNYRIRPDLVNGISQLSDQNKCTKTYVLETAVQKLITEQMSLKF